MNREMTGASPDSGTSPQSPAKPDVPGSIGQFCAISDTVKIGHGVHIGANSTICGDVELGDDVVIGPNVVFPDRAFTSGPSLAPGRTRVEQGASIHANSTIMPGIVIGAGSRIAPGSVVAHSVPPHAVVSGNPARIVGYVDALPTQPSDNHAQPPFQPTPIAGVTLHHLPLIQDIRGSLTVGEFGRTVPFDVKRYFVVLGVPSRETRGEHAHRACTEMLVCVAGNCSVVADDGYSRQEFLLDKPNVGLLLPPMVWRVHYKYSSEAVLVVFASEYYDPGDYIRDYSQFLAEVRAKT